MNVKFEFVNLDLLISLSFIGQFVYPLVVVGDEVKGLEGGDRYFSPLQVFLY